MTPARWQSAARNRRSAAAQPGSARSDEQQRHDQRRHDAASSERYPRQLLRMLAGDAETHLAGQVVLVDMRPLQQADAADEAEAGRALGRRQRPQLAEPPPPHESWRSRPPPGRRAPATASDRARRRRRPRRRQHRRQGRPRPRTADSRRPSAACARPAPISARHRSCRAVDCHHGERRAGQSDRHDVAAAPQGGNGRA